MKIIREGDLELAKRKKERTAKFQCPECNCLWYANKDEYEDQSNQHDGIILACVCPCCKAKAYSYDYAFLT